MLQKLPSVKVVYYTAWPISSPNGQRVYRNQRRVSIDSLPAEQLMNQTILMQIVFAYHNF